MIVFVLDRLCILTLNLPPKCVVLSYSTVVIEASTGSGYSFLGYYSCYWVGLVLKFPVLSCLTTVTSRLELGPYCGLALPTNVLPKATSFCSRLSLFLVVIAAPGLNVVREVALSERKRD